MAQEQLSADWKPTNFFETTLSADATDSDTDIFLSDVPTESEGTLVINPDSTTNREIIYYNSKTASKVVCPSAALGRGYDGTTATSHTSGTKVIMAPIADWFNSMRTLFTTTPQGWTSMGATNSVTTGYNSGNRSFTIDTSADLSGTLSPGMRYKVDRGTTPPTQCAALEASSSHYATNASPTGTPSSATISIEADVMVESYTGTNQFIVTRRASSGGWQFLINSSGQIQMGAGESGQSFDDLTSYQSIPLGKWVHVAATLTVNSGGSMYIEGVAVPAAYTNGTSTTTSATGTLAVGARVDSLGSYFNGKLADVRVWSDIRTETEIQDNMYAYPSDTTGLVAHFKLNGDFTDASSNSNDLTAQNSAVATNVDNPWNATEYGIITAVSASTIQVFCPEGYGIPNETISSPYYSTQSTPYGFPRDKGRWTVEMINQTLTQSLSSTTTFAQVGNGHELEIPLGSWNVSYMCAYQNERTSGSAIGALTALSSNTTSASDITLQNWSSDLGSANYSANVSGMVSGHTTISSATTFYILYRDTTTTGTTGNQVRADELPSLIRAECAYL